MDASRAFSVYMQSASLPLLFFSRCHPALNPRILALQLIPVMVEIRTMFQNVFTFSTVLVMAACSLGYLSFAVDEVELQNLQDCWKIPCSERGCWMADEKKLR